MAHFLLLIILFGFSALSAYHGDQNRDDNFHKRPLPRQAGPATSANAAPSATVSPTCIEPRSPNGPSGNAINKAIILDDTVEHACNKQFQKTVTIHDGDLITIYNSLNNAYFFNASHSSAEVNFQVVSEHICSAIINNILLQCVFQQQFWGGWIATEGTNYSGQCSVTMSRSRLMFLLFSDECKESCKSTISDRWKIWCIGDSRSQYS